MYVCMYTHTHTDIYIYIYIYIYIDSVKTGQFSNLRLFGPVEEKYCQNICSCCYIHPHHIALACGPWFCVSNFKNKKRYAEKTFFFHYFSTKIISYSICKVISFLPHTFDEGE